jgi:hypothetical protein
VQDEPTPNLDRERYSAEICDFIDQCLQKEQRHRPTAHQFMAHPFITATESTRLTIVNDQQMGCDLLRVRLTEDVVLGFLEYYYTTLRENPRDLFELYADESECTLASVGAYRGPDEICRGLCDIYEGAPMIDVDPSRVQLTEIEGGLGFEARVEGSLLLRQDGDGGVPKSFADVIQIVSEGMTLMIKTESHECWG